MAISSVHLSRPFGEQRAAECAVGSGRRGGRRRPGPRRVRRSGPVRARGDRGGLVARPRPRRALAARARRAAAPRARRRSAARGGGTRAPRRSRRGARRGSRRRARLKREGRSAQVSPCPGVATVGSGLAVMAHAARGHPRAQAGRASDRHRCCAMQHFATCNGTALQFSSLPLRGLLTFGLFVLNNTTDTLL